VEPEDVPAGPLALDTDVFSFIEQRKGPYKDFARLIGTRPLALPFPVVAEVTVVAIRAGFQEKRIAALQDQIKRCTVIPSDSRVVAQWAQMRAKLLDQLKGDGANDMWIAACCLVHDLPLVTHNLSDFQKIQTRFSGLRLVHPTL
jgi:tRNA(fMet)-specific endonuclease VapC